MVDITYTPALQLPKPPFDTTTWHDYWYDAMDILDGAWSTFSNIIIRGVWLNNTVYAVGDRVVDTNDGLLYGCLVAHTSAAAGNMAADRAAHPTFWFSMGAFQPLDTDLTALAALATTGLVARTGAGTVSARTLTAPAAGITVTNGGGVAGNPTLVLANDLLALEGLGSTGFPVRTAADTWTQRTITGTANAIVVTAGDGVAGNPTIDLAATLAFTGKTITAGTFTTPTLSDPSIVSTTGSVSISYTDNGSALNPALKLSRISNSPATSDFGPALDFVASNSAAAQVSFARILLQTDIPNAGIETAILLFQTITTGAMSTQLQLWEGPDNLGEVYLPKGRIRFVPTANLSVDANTLDDYEEGSYTITSAGTTAAGVGTYTLQTGTYQKVGNRINFEFECGWSAHTGTGNLKMAGLPYSAGNQLLNYAFLAIVQGLTYTTAPVTMILPTGSTEMTMDNYPLTGASLVAVAMDTVVAAIRVSGSYPTQG